MKFGKFLLDNSVPSWKHQYVDYKNLKKILKQFDHHDDSLSGEENEEDVFSTNHSTDIPWVILRNPINGKSELLHNRVNAEGNKSTLSKIDTLNLTSLIPDNVKQHDIEHTFMHALEHDVQKVSQFYLTKCNYFEEQLDILKKKIGIEEALDLQPLENKYQNLRNRLKRKSDKTTKLNIRFESGYKERKLERATTQLSFVLSQLMHYHSVNIIAINKILKKHDKASQSWNTSYSVVLPAIMNHVIPDNERAELLRSKVEKLYIQVFADGKRDQGLAILRSARPDPEHKTTFAAGLVVGLLVAVLALIGILFGINPELIHSPHILSFFSVFRVLVTIPLLVWLWGIDLFVFEQLNISVDSIMNVPSRTSSYLHGNQLLLISGGILLLSLSSMAIVLCIVLFAPDNLENTVILYVPSWVAVGILLLLVCVPCNIFHHLFRRELFFHTLRVITAPLKRVTFADSFLADQFTSLGVISADIAYMICFLCMFSDNTCGEVSGNARYVLTFLPYWWRFAQCLRKYIDDPKKDLHNVYNAGKYLVAIFVTLSSILYGFSKHDETASESMVYRRKIGWIFFATIGTIYSYLWDIRNDWGLLKRNAPYFLLSKQLRLHPAWYYFAMVSNSLMRLAWVVTISPFADEKHGYEIIRFAAALLEICRRGQWNVFRIIHEDNKTLSSNYHELRREEESVEDESMEEEKDSEGTEEEKVSQYGETEVSVI